MPTYSEIAKIVGFRSKNAVFRLVKRLEKEKFIEKDSSGRLIPKSLYGDVRVLGLVEAGFPSPAEEELSDSMNLDEWLIENKDATYMLTVKGDSMYDAGIREGDVVLVERTEKYKEGSIVIAEVDGQWTMKYLRKGGRGYFLEAANRKYKPIYPEEELNIAAVVKVVIRKY